jgi:hypothetical protein
MMLEQHRLARKFAISRNTVLDGVLENLESNSLERHGLLPLTSDP